uniref:Putative ribonuclease H-like domain-containing protein n=1 Tax=Tanacetum cinerariifolium TaxID=118510 RepID=A0A6L2JM86_TANCI|nr:putative ribonuclease H-like domain-containing protein [Tanacetum cinerariifolium]
MDHKVKIIKYDNGTEFKNRIMNELCEMKGIRREFSVARTSLQNGVAERKNKTLIEAARTMLADSKLPTTFWAKAVNTACYVQNKVLVIKPYNKTPYELFLGPKSSEDDVADDARKKSTKVPRKENGVQDLEDTDDLSDNRIFSDAYDDEVEGAVADFNNLELTTVATAKVKNVNGEAQIQALVDKKKVIITEASIKRDLWFKDKGGVDYLSNEVIFEQLTLVGHNAVFIISSHTKKVFANMKRERKDFSRKKAKTAKAVEISSLKKRVKKLEKKKKSRTLGLKRLWKVRTARRIESLTEASLGDQEDASEQRRMIDNIDQDVEITLVDDTQGRLNKEEIFGVNDLDGDEVVVVVTAGENVEQSAKVAKMEVSTAATTPPKVKGIVMQKPSETPSTKPSQAKDKGKRKMVEPESEKEAEGSEKAEEGISKRAGSNLEQGDAKRQRLKEENESAKLKRCLEIVLDDEDDVTIKAIPLSSKSPTIVDYKIYKEGRKSYFKIIRGDGNSQNYLTFGKMFKNFEREDLEVL